MNNKVILIFVAFILAFSCTKIDNTLSESDDCLVSINLIGEITTDETPLTKGSSTSSNDIYAVQVYRNGSRFAWGVFDDVSYMKLNLKKGFIYNVQICMVKDAKNYISYYSLTNGGVDTGLSSGPFYAYRTSYYTKSNTFFYNSNGGWYYYGSNTATSTTWNGNYASQVEFTQIRQGKLNDVSYPTCTDWFYGEISNYSPDGEFGSMYVPLKRSGFKLKYELSGVTDGSVTVKVYNGTRTFINKTTTTSTYESDTQFIAFYDTYSAWQYADNYTENMTVAVTWVRGIGITQDLGTKTVQIKRNCLNNIKITLGSDDRGAGVSLSTESESSMGSADNNIPVE